MSLNFDLTAIPLETRTIVADHDKPNPFYQAGKSKPENEFEYRKGDRLMSPITNALIWGTMFVDMGAITEENVDEFFARTAVHEKLSGAYLSETNNETGETKPRPITLQDVRDHIGLKTNVSTLTRAKWMKRVLDYAMKDAVERAKARLEREAPKAA
jgi:hypothetical protein